MSYRHGKQPKPSKDLDISNVTGNVSDDIKRLIAYPWESLYLGEDDDGQWRWWGYNADLFKRIKVTEVSVEKNVLEPKKFTGKVVCEMDVERGEFIVANILRL
jgi:acyl-coenzyme A thioesterase 13